MMPTLRNAARATPDKIACTIAETGESLTFAELDRHSNRLANLFDDMGLQEGDVVGIMLANDMRYCEIAFAARRRGLYFAPISWHLAPEEVEFILRDCGAKVVFTNTTLVEKVHSARLDARVILVDGTDPSDDYVALRDEQPDEWRDTGRPTGKDLCYSSGTTGRPKGIRHALNLPPEIEKATGEWLSCFGFGPDTVYLSPAPLYHAAPLRFVIRVIAGGGTAVIMQKFDALRALDTIDRFRVTHSQWVPTMLFRMLALPETDKARFDLSSHRVAIHAASPCPPEIKDRMIDWWGPILWEYYSGSERMGATAISATEWQQHRGSVGRAKLGVIHILGDNDTQLGPNQIGRVFFDGPSFSYHNDPEKTARAYSRQGWSTLGDIGYVDDDGYLYLTDRQAHMIISGGVNIYPAETENVMILHPDVEDVCVFGIPNPEFGEEVKAAVQLTDPAMASDAMAQALLDFCRTRLSPIKLPRSIDFHEQLPRQENGKLNKQVLKKPYLDQTAAQ